MRLTVDELIDDGVIDADGYAYRNRWPYVPPQEEAWAEFDQVPWDVDFEQFLVAQYKAEEREAFAARFIGLDDGLIAPGAIKYLPETWLVRWSAW